jgi:beta-lactamase superfamily II metal-dependent hydrolase
MDLRRAVFRLLVLSALVVFSSATFAQQLEIHYINVGWGGSVLVKGPNGTTVLMEAGNAGKGNARVVPYLRSIGIMPASGLDYTIAGHQHCDHIGGLDEVVQAGYNVRVKNYYNGSSYASRCVDQWNTVAASTTAGAPVVPSVGSQILLGNGARLTIIARNGSVIGGGSVSVSDENDRSIAVLIQYGGFDYIWGSDMGGGNIDEACTGRFTSSQADVESLVIHAISPGGTAPMISSGGIDVLHVNHHGSESSTNMNWMNLSRPAVALISTGSGESVGWDLPRIDVVQRVLLAQATACITVPPALVLQTEEGAPTGSRTSFAGYCVGDIKVTTDGVSTFTVTADGAVTQGPNELSAAGLPRTFYLDDLSLPPPMPQIRRVLRSQLHR